MAKINFNLREPNSKSNTPINLVIRWNNKRLVYPTGESINPKFWEADKAKSNFQRAKQTKQFRQYPEFNAKLDLLENGVKDVFRKYQNDNLQLLPTPNDLKSLLDKKFSKNAEVVGKLTLMEFVEKFIKDSETRNNDKTGKPVSKVTIRVYKRCLELLKEFQKVSRKRIDFDSFDLDFYHDFTAHLTKEHNFSHNTVGKHIKSLKTFLNSATESGLNTNLAYKSKRFKALTEKSESIYLNENEINELMELDLSNNLRLEKVRDLFIVGCWTGLRFSDFSRIEKKNIRDGFIEIETQKTAHKVVIPIHSTVLKIMKKYGKQYPNSLPPAVSNQKMNQYLKEVAKKVNSFNSTISTTITKGGLKVTTNNKKFDLITTHTARRSFATNLYLDNVPAFNIMQITGHKTEKAFLTYIKITPNESAKILQLHWKKKIKLKKA